MRKVGRENEKDKARGGDIATRRGRKGSRRDRAIERPFPFDCRDVWGGRAGGGENQGDFVRMCAQNQIGELGVENDSAKESSIGDRRANAFERRQV